MAYKGLKHIRAPASYDRLTGSRWLRQPRPWGVLRHTRIESSPQSRRTHASCPSLASLTRWVFYTWFLRWSPKKMQTTAAYVACCITFWLTCHHSWWFRYLFELCRSCNVRSARTSKTNTRFYQELKSSHRTISPSWILDRWSMGNGSRIHPDVLTTIKKIEGFNPQVFIWTRQRLYRFQTQIEDLPNVYGALRVPHITAIVV